MDLLYCGTRRGCEKEYWAIGLSITYTPIFFFPLYILSSPPPPPPPLTSSYSTRVSEAMVVFATYLYYLASLWHYCLPKPFFSFSLAFLVYAHLFSDLHHG